jgi:hypothetical protein
MHFRELLSDLALTSLFFLDPNSHEAATERTAHHRLSSGHAWNSPVRVGAWQFFLLQLLEK